MSTSSQAAIPANPSRRQAKGKARKTRDISGLTSSTPFAHYDRDTHSLRTSEATLLSDSETFSPTLPPAGILRNGKLYQRRRLALHTVATASSSWPTPTASDHIRRKSTQQKPGSRHSLTLPDAVERWPTPRSSAAMNENIEQIQKRLADGAPYKAKLEEAVALWPTPTTVDTFTPKSRKNPTLGDAARSSELSSGKLNPTWVEWLMGFPLGWTDLEDSGTPSSLKSPNGSGD